MGATTVLAPPKLPSSAIDSVATIGGVGGGIATTTTATAADNPDGVSSTTVTDRVTAPMPQQQQQQQQQQQSPSSVPQGRVKQLQSVADRLGCTLNQLMVAWSVRNQTSQSCVVSAATRDQFQELLDALSVSFHPYVQYFQKAYRIWK